MRLSDLLYETWSALLANKGRSLLTILGIVIGIAAVIAMTSLIGGVKDALVSQLGLDQSRVVQIDYWNGAEKTEDDLRAIESNVSGYEFVSAMQYGSSQASTQTKQSNVTVLGVTSGFFRTIGASLSAGRLLTDQELSSDSLSIVVDSNLVKALFGADEDPVGQMLTLGNDEYVIVGVVEAPGMFGSQGTAYMPMHTCNTRITGYREYSQIIGFANEGVDMQDLSERTESFLREHLNISEESETEGFGYVYVQSIESLQKELDSTMMSFQLLMSAVAGISLLVGGIGIMNMMLTNVTERIREIGLRKALGARRSSITLQFLMESVAICLIGGVIGFLFGFGGAYLLASLSSGLMGQAITGEALSITPSISLSTVFLAVGICAAIGIVFGFWPAYRAAKLDPVESLRFQ